MCDTHIVLGSKSIPAMLCSFFLLSNLSYLDQSYGLHYWPINSEIIESLTFL